MLLRKFGTGSIKPNISLLPGSALEEDKSPKPGLKTGPSRRKKLDIW